MQMWYEETATIKEDKAVVKLYDENNKFSQSIIVPTMYYPLNGKLRVYNYKNTKKIEDINILKAFDKVNYKIGSCYTNTKELVKELKKEGYNIKSYVGWLFTGQTETPIHHCWAVINDNSILDLADDFTVMLSGDNAKNFESLNTKIERAEMIANFQLAARNVKNSIRCSPVGVPTQFLLYVGSECEPEKGKEIYRNLIKQYPDHECQRNLDAEGYNETQRVMKKVGLIR